MIDLHCHILPGVDDGAPDLETALDMARMAADDGITVIACTPHFNPGVFDNDGPAILTAIDALQGHLNEAGIPISLVCGGDIHTAPGLVAKLRAKQVLSLNHTKYALIEPPHTILPPRIEHVFFDLLSAGFQPILTHPERMRWIEAKYGLITEMFHRGVWMQLTAGAIVGEFGREAKRWSERMIGDGMAHIIASDAHHSEIRRPLLSAACKRAEALVGGAEALNMVLHRPALILRDGAPTEIPAPDAAEPVDEPDETFWSRLTAAFRGR